MAADLLIRNIQLETNKLYQFETRMKSNIDEKRKTFNSLKEHANAAQNRFYNSRQFESSKDGVIEGERDELRKGKETVNGFKQTVNVMGLEIHQMKEVVEREIELIPSLQHDSIYYQKERINLMKKEREEEQQMLDQIQDGKQEVEVTEHRLNMVIKVNNEEIMKSKAEILDLSQQLSNENGEIEAKQKQLSSNFSLAASHAEKVESQKKILQEMTFNENLVKNQLIKKEEQFDAIEAQLKLENEKALEKQTKIQELTSEHENLVNEMQTTSSKITQYIMDWQLQSNLQMLKINVFDSERLEEKLCEQACQLKEMSLKMENLVLEKTTIENEKAKIQELMANLDNLQGKKEEVAKECENLESELTVKMNLIEDMKKKLDDAKEVEKQYKALDQQLKTLSSKKESMAINLLALEGTYNQISISNESVNNDIKELRKKLDDIEVDDLDMDDDNDVPEETVEDIKAEIEKVRKEMQEKQEFHDNLKREIERQHKAKKKSLLEMNLVPKSKPPTPTIGGQTKTAPIISSAKRGSPIASQSEVNSKKFRPEGDMPPKSPFMSYLKETATKSSGLSNELLPPPKSTSKTRPKSRAAAQKAKKLFAVDEYSVYDESP